MVLKNILDDKLIDHQIFLICLHYGFAYICKKKVSVVSEISEVTINKCYKKLEQLNIELIPKQILNKYNN